MCGCKQTWCEYNIISSRTIKCVHHRLARTLHVFQSRHNVRAISLSSSSYIYPHKLNTPADERRNTYLGGQRSPDERGSGRNKSCKQQWPSKFIRNCPAKFLFICQPISGCCFFFVFVFLLFLSAKTNGKFKSRQFVKTHLKYTMKWIGSRCRFFSIVRKRRTAPGNNNVIGSGCGTAAAGLANTSVNDIREIPIYYQTRPCNHFPSTPPLPPPPKSEFIPIMKYEVSRVFN